MSFASPCVQDLDQKRTSAAGYLGFGGLERALAGNWSPQPKVSIERDADDVKTLFFKTVATSFNKNIRLFALNECFNKHFKKYDDFKKCFQQYNIKLCSMATNAPNLRSLITKTKLELV